MAPSFLTPASLVVSLLDNFHFKILFQTLTSYTSQANCQFIQTDILSIRFMPVLHSCNQEYTLSLSLSHSSWYFQVYFNKPNLSRNLPNTASHLWMAQEMRSCGSGRWSGSQVNCFSDWESEISTEPNYCLTLVVQKIQYLCENVQLLSFPALSATCQLIYDCHSV